MRKPFREHHLFQILAEFEGKAVPLDAFLRHYFRTHSSVGSKDRKEICEAIYGMMRWRSLLDFLSGKPHSWESRFRVFQEFSLEQALADSSIPAHIRASFPKAFYELLANSLGEEKAFAFCLCSNEKAPTTVRANLLKTTREMLLDTWKGRFKVDACRYSPSGITFEEKINFFGQEEFKAGLFEVQDEGSQLIADLVKPRPGDQFLDYCAGSGGKSLAIAPQMQGRGQLFLHDIRPSALQEAKKRLKRAGIQNAQVLFPDAPHKALLKERMDWVLVDAPCTGTGTLRRNPDMKWKFETAMLDRLIAEQRQIFAEALAYLKVGGHIVYATCSVLPQENEQQAAYFTHQFPVQPIAAPFASFPKSQAMDGFFGVVFKKIQAYTGDI